MAVEHIRLIYESSYLIFHDGNKRSKDKDRSRKYRIYLMYMYNVYFLGLTLFNRRISINIYGPPWKFNPLLKKAYDEMSDPWVILIIIFNCRKLERQCISIISFGTSTDILDCPIWILCINVVAMEMLRTKISPCKYIHNSMLIYSIANDMQVTLFEFAH